MDSKPLTLDMQPNKPGTLALDDDDWYEHGFTRIDGDRKRGVTAMPLSAAQTLLKWAGYVPSADLAGKIVIDPACGSGNTLLAATQALAARGRVRRWGAERVAQEIERCIWGLDPDPIACHVTELRLHRLIAHIIPDLTAARRKALQLHIHQTDSLALPADARFHLVITNPPLVTARGIVVSYGGFASKAPPRDVWLRFLEQSMRLVAYGGTLAIALPEALLTKSVAAALRAELREEWTIGHLGHLTGLFRCGPGTLMLQARRSAPSPESSILWERSERFSMTKKTVSLPGTTAPPSGATVRSLRAEHRLEGSMPQAMLAESARGPWRYALGAAERAFIDRLEKTDGTIARLRLSEIVTITRGAEVHKEAPDPAPAPVPGGVPLLRGIDVAPFLAQGGRAWLPAGAFKADPTNWRAPKLVLPRAGAVMAVALDTSGAAPLTALLVLQARALDPAPQETLLWLSALLNARALRAYLVLQHTAYMLARPMIDLDALRMLPIAQGPADSRQRIIGLASELAHHYALHGNSPEDAMQYPVGQRLQATIDMEVNALYGIQASDKAIMARWLDRA